VPSLEAKQAAMRLKRGRRLDSVAETKCRAAMFLLLSCSDDEEDDVLGRVGRQFGRDKAWMEKWAKAKFPLLSYF
jgi:hypothetical protein